MKKVFLLMLVVVLINFGVAAPPIKEHDLLKFQGQYFIGDEFQKGTYEFMFDIYDDVIGGGLVYSFSNNITTGNWGQWEIELEGISAVASDPSIHYFMEIVIDGVSQLPRKRITQLDFFRTDIDVITKGNIVTEGVISAAGFSPSLDDDTISFIDPFGVGWLQLTRDRTLFSERNVTSLSLISEDGLKDYVGFSYYDSIGNGVVPWVWANVQGEGGGYTLITSEGVSEAEKDHIVLGRFTQESLTLGTDSSLDENTEFSKGMDFIIFKDKIGGKAFFVDSNADYKTTINADLEVNGNISFNGNLVCLSDGTNCLSGSGGVGNDLNVDSLNVRDFAVFEARTVPSDPEVGMVYLDDGKNELRFYDGEDWLNIVMSKVKGGGSPKIKGASFTGSSVENIVEEVEEELVEEEIVKPKEVCEEVCEIEEVCENINNESVCEEVESCKEECGIPEQLFDIWFDLDETLISGSEELSGIISFISFGRVPASVALEVVVLDRDGVEIYSDISLVTVSTENVVRWKYNGEELGEGAYVVVLTTLYNVDVVDEFKQDVEIKYGLWKKIGRWFE